MAVCPLVVNVERFKFGHAIILLALLALLRVDASVTIRRVDIYERMARKTCLIVHVSAYLLVGVIVRLILVNGALLADV